MENWHEYIFFENSKSIGFSVYLDSQGDIEPPCSNYGQQLSGHLGASATQAFGPHPHLLKRIRILTWLICTKHLRSAKAEECPSSTQL